MADSTTTDEQRVRNVVGHARTIRTAVSVCEFLRDACCAPHSKVSRDRVIYEFKEPSAHNGCWSATILVDGHMSHEDATLFVVTCRAFVAGAGEVWI